MRRVSGLVLVATLVMARAAWADKASDAEAKRYFDEATRWYSIGEFNKAIENYKLAYQAKPDPVFLYNIGQGYRLLKDYDQALFFYRSFLRNQPSAQNRAEVEARIKEVEELRARAKVAVPPPEDVAEDSDTGEETRVPPPPAVPADRPAGKPIYKKWWFWAGIGAVAVGTVAVVAASSGGGGGADAPATRLGTNTVSF